MDMTYQVIALALLVGSVVTGFITFRMQGMKLAIHFGAIMLALLATLAAIATGMPALVSAAAVLQVLVAVTAFTQLWETLKYTFQTSPGYGAHMALVTMLPVFAVAAVAL